MARPILLEHARVLTPADESDESVVVADGKIVQIGGKPPLDAERLSLNGNWLVPGLIDLHVHGGGGAQFTSGSIDDCLKAARFHAKHGTTSLLATTLSAPPQMLLDAVRAIAQATVAHDPTGAALVGCHLEGPFLNAKRCGAMNPAYMRAPDAGELRRLIEAGEGSVRMVAVAPELPGARDLIAAASAQGITPAIGHSDATYEQANAAIDAGARHAIHLFNAMRPFRHRDPGIIGAVLERAEVTCELIADGHHVHPAALRLAAGLKGPSAVLVTDAVQAAGMPDGRYRLGEADIRVVDGRAVLADRDALAGSTLTMDAAVRGAVELIGLPLSEAVTMATATPARVIGLDQQVGRIAPGYRADLAVLDDQLRVVATLRDGRFVHGSAAQWS